MSLSVVFFGTPSFAVPSLLKLTQFHNVVAVVSQPDKPKGRGKHLLPTAVKEAATELDIPVYQPASVKDPEFINQMKELGEIDLFVTAAYGQIFPQELLDLPRLGCINVHGSLLPKYRGAAPIQWAILNGETQAGITIMYMEKGLDSGDIILQSQLEIEDMETYGSLYTKLAHLGADTLVAACNLLSAGTQNPIKQNPDEVTYASLINKDMAQIDWKLSSSQIVNQIRAYNPTPVAFSFLNGKMMKIWQASEVIGYDAGGAPGQIVTIDKKQGIVVKTGDGAIILREVQEKGGKKMSCADYLRGHNVQIGEIFQYLIPITVNLRVK